MRSLRRFCPGEPRTPPTRPCRATQEARFRKLAKLGDEYRTSNAREASIVYTLSRRMASVGSSSARVPPLPCGSLIGVLVDAASCGSVGSENDNASFLNSRAKLSIYQSRHPIAQYPPALPPNPGSLRPAFHTRSWSLPRVCLGLQQDGRPIPTLHDRCPLTSADPTSQQLPTQLQSTVSEAD